MRISDWSSDVCSSDLVGRFEHRLALTQNTNGAGSGILGARGSRRPRELGETGIDERIVRARSEEHTSELQSLMRISYAVFCLKKQTEITRRSEKRQMTRTSLTTSNKTKTKTAHTTH